MPRQQLPSQRKQFTLGIDIQTNRPRKLKIEAVDAKKPFTKYYQTVGDVHGFRHYDLLFPQSPELLDVRIYDAHYKSYADFIKNTDSAVRNSIRVVDTQIKPLKTKPIWLTPQDEAFIKFAQKFSENAGLYSGTNHDGSPSIYRSADGKFTIDYYDKIIDRQTKQFVGTPARIGHQTGVIEVSKNAFKNYTIPMRMVILLHEYSHKWRNPSRGLRVENESGADINALEIYLSLGYSPIEAHQAFLYVFKDADNDLNHNRYLIIKDFIQKFNDGKLKHYYSTQNVVKK